MINRHDVMMFGGIACVAAVAITLFVKAGHTGDLNEHCNPNGRCSHPDLVCGSMGYCSAQPQGMSPATFQMLERDTFCRGCSLRCGKEKMKSCTYDASKLTTCECQP